MGTRWEQDTQTDHALLDAILGEYVEGRWPAVRTLIDRAGGKAERWHEIRGSGNMLPRAMAADGYHWWFRDISENYERHGYGGVEPLGGYEQTWTQSLRYVLRESSRSSNSTDVTIREHVKGILRHQLALNALLALPVPPLKASIQYPDERVELGRVAKWYNGPYVAPIGHRHNKGTAMCPGMSQQLALALDWQGRWMKRGKMPAPRWRQPEECAVGMPFHDEELGARWLRLRGGGVESASEYGEGDMAITQALAMDGTLVGTTSPESWGLREVERDTLKHIVHGVWTRPETHDLLPFRCPDRNGSIEIARIRNDEGDHIVAAMGTARNHNVGRRKFNVAAAVVGPRESVALVPGQRSEVAGVINWGSGEVVSWNQGSKCRVDIPRGKCLWRVRWGRNGLEALERPEGWR